MTAKDTLLALLVVGLWGFNFVAAKVSLQDFPPLFLTCVRFCLVAAVLFPFLRVPREKLPGIALLSVILGSIHFPMMFTGIGGVDAATASVVAQLQVPFSSLLAAVFFKDRLGWRRAAGMGVAFAGVALIAGEPRMSGSLWPLTLIVAASFAFACASMQIKRIGAIDGYTLNAWLALLAAPQLFVLSLLVEEGQWHALTHATAAGWTALVYTALASTIVAYGIWYRLLRVYEVNQAVPFMLLVPVFGVLSGVLILNDPFTLTLAIGGFLTVAGVGVIVLRRPGTVSDKVSNPT